MRSLLFLALLAGCGGRTEETSVTDAAVDAASDAVKSDATADAAPVCFGEGGSVPSVPFKLCTNDSDCVAIAHQTDCCGNTLMVGVTRSQQAAFNTCEEASRAKFPGCGCPSGPPQTEDGKTIEFGAMPLVRCTNFTSSGGVCMTAAP